MVSSVPKTRDGEIAVLGFRRFPDGAGRVRRFYRENPWPKTSQESLDLEPGLGGGGRGRREELTVFVAGLSPSEFLFFTLKYSPDGQL